MGQSYPLPITTEMLAPANPNEGAPRAVPADYAGGVVGNDWDVATAAVAIADQNGGTGLAYTPRTQAEKASISPTNYTGVASDIGKDYGEYAEDTGRTGTIAPLDPYPVTVPEPPPEPEP